MRARLAAAATGAALASLPGVALAHDGSAANAGDLGEALRAWSFDPGGVIVTGLVAAAYGWGYLRLRRTAPGFRFPRWQVIAFGAGIVLLLLTLISPIDRYSDDLFWAHMVQHMLLVMLVAPLLLLGAPATLALRAASGPVRRRYIVPLLRSRLLRLLTYPPVALLLFIAAIWIWHLPTLYEAAIDSEALHFVEHFAFLGGASLFWWLIIGVDATHLRPGHVARIALLLLAIVQNIGLALVLASVDRVLYATYEAAALARDWGPSAITDQRIGAGVMWVPGAMMLALAVIVTVYYWAESEGFKGRQGDLVRALERRRAAGPPPGG